MRRSIGASKEVAELALKRVEAELAKINTKSLSIPHVALEVMDRHLNDTVQVERLATYPGIRNPTNFRELFIRIYDKLEFEVLKSQVEFPNYLLSSENRLVRAHTLVRSSNFQEEGLDDLGCDCIVC